MLKGNIHVELCTMVGLTTMLNWRFVFNMICQHAQYPTKCTHLALIILSPYRHNTNIHIILFTKFITSQTVAYQLHHRKCQLKPQSHSSLSVAPTQVSTKRLVQVDTFYSHNQLLSTMTLMSLCQLMAFAKSKLSILNIWSQEEISNFREYIHVYTKFTLACPLLLELYH